MSRNVRVVVLCEDRQHETFLRRFLRKTHWNTRDLRIERAPVGRGSAESYVRSRFPRELQALRSKGEEEVYLIVLIDGDRQGSPGRISSLETACVERGLSPPNDRERVMICVPTWNIETWIAYLDGQTVDESRSDYPHLPRQRDCEPAVQNLVEMCRERTLRAPFPSSLKAACLEYQRVFG